MKLTNKKYDQAVLVCALSALSVSAWASSQSSALTEWPEGMDTKTFAAAQRDKFLLEKSSLEASIQAEAFAAINRKQQFQHRTQFIPLSLQLKPSEYGIEVLADVGEALGPWSNGHEMEDLERLIHNVAYNRLGERYGAVGVTMLFGGRTMYFYHPQERTPQKSESASAGNPSGPLMLSAGQSLRTARGVGRVKVSRKSWRPITTSRCPCAPAAMDLSRRARIFSRALSMPMA